MRWIKRILIAIGLFAGALAVAITCAIVFRSHWQKEWVPPDQPVDLQSKWQVLREADVPPDSAFGLLRRAAEAQSRVPKAHDFPKELRRLYLEPWTNESFPLLARFVEDSNEAMKLARAAAAAQNPQVPTYTSITDRFDYIFSVMRLNDAFLASAARNAAAGNFAGAFDDLEVAIADAQILSRGGPLIHVLVDISCEMRACRAMRLLALSQDVPPDVANRAIDRLRLISLTAEPLDETFRQEWRTVPGITRLLFSPSNRSIFQYGEATPAPAWERCVRWSLGRFGWMLGSNPEAVTADLTRVYKSIVTITSQPYGCDRMQQLQHVVPEFRARQLIVRRDPVGYVLAKTMIPAFAPVVTRYHRRALDLNATIAVLALRQFEQTEHRKPSSLDQLVPKYLPALPLDEFDGRPLHYRVNPDGKWVLYSVGPNQTDEDALKPASEPRNCWDPGDVVFSEADFESERHRLPEKR